MNNPILKKMKTFAKILTIPLVFAGSGCDPEKPPSPNRVECTEYTRTYTTQGPTLIEPVVLLNQGSHETENEGKEVLKGIVYNSTYSREAEKRGDKQVRMIPCLTEVRWEECEESIYKDNKLISSTQFYRITVMERLFTDSAKEGGNPEWRQIACSPGLTKEQALFAQAYFMEKHKLLSRFDVDEAMADAKKPEGKRSAHQSAKLNR